MKLEKVNINDLRPAEYNPRVELTPEMEEYNQVKRSIETFGYADPIIVNSDLTVIGGHQRLNVLKDMNYQEIDVIVLDLNKQKEKALNIALNKITGQWDDNKLQDLLSELDDGLDLDAIGFGDTELADLFEDETEEQEEVEEKENARMNTINTYNLQLYDSSDTAGFWDMPNIHKCDEVPNDLIGFNYALSTDESDSWLHFFIDDYQFERLWNRPEQYLETLKKFGGVLTPDFSLYTSMPRAMKLWNIYRSRLLGNYWQSEGLNVIPTISWSERETFDFCFDGVERGSTVAVSTIGVKREESAFEVWKAGMDEMIERIRPNTIFVYGGQLEYDYPTYTNVIYFDNKVTERMNRIGRCEDED